MRINPWNVASLFCVLCAMFFMYSCAMIYAVGSGAEMIWGMLGAAALFLIFIWLGRRAVAVFVDMLARWFDWLLP